MTEPGSKRFDFSGGHVALDFINTLSDRRGEPKDRLPNYLALLFWSEAAKVLPSPHIDGLIDQMRRAPGQAVTVLGDAIALRETLFDIFSSVAENRIVPQNALGRLNNFLMQGASFVRLKQKDRNFHWDWVSANHMLGAMLWPIARAAADLLTSDQLVNVRECDADDCAWLFLDTTRNRSRRWCDMTTCGNRAKARRHYERTKSSTSGEE